MPKYDFQIGDRVMIKDKTRLLFADKAWFKDFQERHGSVGPYTITDIIGHNIILDGDVYVFRCCWLALMDDYYVGDPEIDLQLQALDRKTRKIQREKFPVSTSTVLEIWALCDKKARDIKKWKTALRHISDRSGLSYRSVVRIAEAKTAIALVKAIKGTA